MDNYLQTLPKEINLIIDVYRVENEPNNKIVLEILELLGVHYITVEERRKIDQLLINNTLPFKMEENEKAIHLKRHIQDIENKEGRHISARIYCQNNFKVKLVNILIIKQELVSNSQLVSFLGQLINNKIYSDDSKLNLILNKHQSSICILRFFDYNYDSNGSNKTRYLVGYFKTEVEIVHD